MPKLKTLICKRPSSVLNYNYRREVNCIKKALNDGFSRRLFSSRFQLYIYLSYFQCVFFPSRFVIKESTEAKAEKTPKRQNSFGGKFQALVLKALEVLLRTTTNFYFLILTLVLLSPLLLTLKAVFHPCRSLWQ